jgi:hypothetical protein
MNRPSIRARDLFVSRTKPEICYDPFPYFCIDDYLPKDLYAALYREFPSMTAFDGSNTTGKMAMHRRKLEFREFLASAPTWAATIDAFHGSEFLNDLETFVRPALVRARGVAGLRRWRIGSGGLPLVERPIELSCEFSMLPSGAHLFPHTDKPEKLVSCLLYFPDPEWETRYGGSTDLYRVRDSKHDHNWSNRPVPFSSVDVVFRSEFRPNRLLVFVKSRNSYHGVSPLICPDGMVRKSFNLNIKAAFDGWSHVGKRLLDSYRFRTEAWRFREFAGFEAATRRSPI